MLKNLSILVKREFWEHRGAFIKAPIIIGLVSLVILIGTYIFSLVATNNTNSRELVDSGIRDLPKLHPDMLKLFWDIQMTVSSLMYLVILFFIIFFFLLGSLINDRKDGSILFWKSLPITDSSTVISKLICGIVFVPLVFVCISHVAILAHMLVSSIILLIHGYNPITLVWAPASIFTSIKLMLVGILTQMVWALPIYGWLLFSSAISKSKPFLFAIFIPSIVAFSMYWINLLSFKFTDFEMFKKPLNYLSHSILPYASGVLGKSAGEQSSFDLDKGSAGILEPMLESFGNIQILYGAFFCLIMVTVTTNAIMSHSTS